MTKTNRTKKEHDEMVHYWDNPPIDYYDYPWIEAWGRYSGDTVDYTESMQTKARKEQAPPTAIHYSQWTTDIPHWSTLEDIMNPELRNWMIKYADKYNLKLPVSTLLAWSNPKYKSAEMKAYQASHRQSRAKRPTRPAAPLPK